MSESQKSDMETQEINSQDSQEYLSSDFKWQMPVVDNWAMAEILTANKNEMKTFLLRQKKTFFGRDDIPNIEYENTSTFAFMKADFHPLEYKRISKKHFAIERDDDSGSVFFTPAVITCIGVNGIFVDGKLLKKDQKQILRSGSILKLVRGQDIMKFSYKRSSEMIVPAGCRLFENYFLADSIGKGGCGTVYRLLSIFPTKDKITKQMSFDQHALKIIEKTELPNNPLAGNNQQSNSQVMNEVKVMRTLRNAHVISIKAFFETDNKLLMVLPYCSGGDMLARITHYDPEERYLPEADAKFFAMQLMIALRYLHSKNITHRDVKPENVLLCGTGPSPLLKLADFGCSKMKPYMNTVCGTEIYTAPEIVAKKNYTNKVDIWSAGCLIYAMLCGRVPFTPALQEKDVKQQILKASFTYVPENLWQYKISPTAKSFVNAMLQRQPHNRLSAELLLNHTWFIDDANNNRMSNMYATENINENKQGDTVKLEEYQDEEYQDEEYNDKDKTLTEDLNKTLTSNNVNNESETEQRPKRRRIV